MTFTYTSAHLAKMAASIPGYAEEAGLTIVSGVEIFKDADVQINSYMADVSEALKLAVLVKAPFISVTSVVFWAERIRSTDGYQNLPPAAERLLKAAEKHDDSLMSVEVSWVADGLVYEWVAQSDWIGPLLIGIDAAVEAAETESEAEHEDRMREHYTSIHEAAMALAESPKFRAEQVKNRRHISAAIIAEAGLGEVNEVTLTHHIIPEANKVVNRRALEFEQDFRARKTELAAELSAYPDWYRESTKAKKKLAAIKFLTKKADGHRPMNGNFAEELSEAAVHPVYVSRY